MLGLLLGRQGQDSALVAAEFREAVRLRPDFAQAHNNLGLVLVQSGDDAAGIASLRTAVRLAPDYADARANLGAVLIPTDAEEAVRELEKAVELAPTLVKARFNLAAAYGAGPASGRPKEIEQLRKVVELSPTFARAHLALGKALLRDGSVPEAIQELREAARLEPQRGEAHYQLGLALARAGRQDEAAPVLQKGRELVAEDERKQTANLDLAEGRAALAGRRPRARRGQAEECGPPAARLGGGPERARPRSWRSRETRPAPPTPTVEALELNPADPAAKQGLERLTSPGGRTRRPRADGGARRLHSRGPFQRGRAAARGVRSAAPAVLVGLATPWATPWALSRSSANPSRPWRSPSSWTSRTPRRTRCWAARSWSSEDSTRRRSSSSRPSATSRTPPRSTTTSASSSPSRTTGSRRGSSSKRRVQLDPAYVQAVDALGFALEALGDDDGRRGALRKSHRAQRGAEGPLRLRPREPERLLQPPGRSGQGARVRPAGARARSQVGPCLVLQSQGRRGPGAPGRGGGRPEPGHLPQSSRLLVPLRPGGPVSPAGQDGGEQEGARSPSGASVAKPNELEKMRRREYRDSALAAEPKG